jgi:hypothetical protein
MLPVDPTRPFFVRLEKEGERLVLCLLAVCRLCPGTPACPCLLPCHAMPSFCIAHSTRAGRPTALLFSCFCLFSAPPRALSRLSCSVEAQFERSRRRLVHKRERREKKRREEREEATRKERKKERTISALPLLRKEARKPANEAEKAKRVK